MGDAAGQLSHRLQLLGLGELGFEAAMLGGVEKMQDDPRGLAFGILQRRDVKRPGAVLAFGQGDIDHLVGHRALGGGAEPPGQLGALVLANQLHHRAARQVAAACRDAAKGGVALNDHAVTVENGDARRRILEKLAEAVFRRRQDLLEFAFCAQVADDGARRQGALAALAG